MALGILVDKKCPKCDHDKMFNQNQYTWADGDIITVYYCGNCMERSAERTTDFPCFTEWSLVDLPRNQDQK